MSAAALLRYSIHRCEDLGAPQRTPGHCGARRNFHSWVTTHPRPALPRDRQSAQARTVKLPACLPLKAASADLSVLRGRGPSFRCATWTAACRRPRGEGKESMPHGERRAALVRELEAYGRPATSSCSNDRFASSARKSALRRSTTRWMPRRIVAEFRWRAPGRRRSKQANRSAKGKLAARYNCEPFRACGQLPTGAHLFSSCRRVQPRSLLALENSP